MSTMLILGGDKVAGLAFNLPELSDASLVIVRDKSTSLKRVIKLVWRRRLGLSLLLKMMYCECVRDSNSVGSVPALQVENNKDLLRLINIYRPNRIVLFRAGLVINKEVISCGIPLLNVHCANVPEYGGLGSIERALKDAAWGQNATLHQVTTTIDSGVVFDTEPFTLNPNQSYCKNESIAYKAGIVLLQRTLRSNVGVRG